MLTRIDFYISTHAISETVNFLTRFSMMTLGKSNENNDWQVFTILVSQVLKSFIKKTRFVTKSGEFRSFLVICCLHVSVCLSQVGVLLKRLNVGSR